MKRKCIMALLIIICVLLQASVCPMIAIGEIKPNLLIILTVSFGLMRGKKEGMLTGFFCGLLTDIFFESTIGLNALIYLWVGYFSGYFYRIFYDDDIKTPLLLISVGDLVFGVVQYVVRFLLRGRVNFPFYLGRIILPEVVYTLLLTFLCYQIFYRINRSMALTDE
ncbi:MAG: rod shape-determining protein MreD [Lachnospiraceae bacterium]|nr:rod shape-determining protein MreD [Lachnospiraceae bacterium]